ncbi:MAG TPA: RpiB/LacA/LacB family sugar-phosphate isomerase [Candidatus Marinimicrobia bacterium]|nr:RpiB/LacA/LacB family sugar-phosphate isomerase [Candidatus Neomarinimicrobiota bacterium]
MKIAVSTDERTDLVETLLKELNERHHTVEYIGPEAGEDADWPEVTCRAAELVASGAADEGIVMCWTGTGASIAANKVKGVRAALCRDAETAKGARIWNHANVLALSLQATSESILKEILDAWFSTKFSDDEWNLKQIERIRHMETKLD